MNRLSFFSFASIAIMHLAGCGERHENTASTDPYHITESITGVTKIDSAIYVFAQNTFREDSVFLFKVYLSNRYDFQRINVFPTKNIGDNIYPSRLVKKDELKFLIYDCFSPKSNVPDTEIKALYDGRMTEQNSNYSPAVLQYDIFGKDSIVKNVPAKNPYDRDGEMPVELLFGPK